jgi:hypothetical protein
MFRLGNESGLLCRISFQFDSSEFHVIASKLRRLGIACRLLVIVLINTGTPVRIHIVTRVSFDLPLLVDYRCTRKTTEERDKTR